jgi:vancomycin resistance protein VanW
MAKIAMDFYILLKCWNIYAIIISSVCYVFGGGKMRSCTELQEPVKRSALRIKCGIVYYSFLRRVIWLTKRAKFASRYGEPLPYSHFCHETILLRKLKDLDMQYQYNKITNLKIAASKLNGIILRPGEVFSFWKLIGKPTRSKGYSEGMELYGGKVKPGVGGGLCQMSNLIYWMTLHTPLRVIERHRHGYDVFPDSNRTQPFGSGATCFYPYIDLMIKNETNEDFQLLINVGEEFLESEWRSTTPPALRYEIIEKNHIMRAEYWGGFSRCNEIYRRTFNLEGQMIDEELVTANAALMMYSPFLSESAESAT